MNNQDQLDYLLNRQRQQVEFSQRATVPDIIAFHDRLADHYRRLADETQASMRPRPVR